MHKSFMLTVDRCTLQIKNIHCQLLDPLYQTTISTLEGVGTSLALQFTQPYGSPYIFLEQDPKHIWTKDDAMT